MSKERFVSDADVKRCVVYCYCSDSIIEYVDLIAKRASISRAEAIRNLIPKNIREFRHYIKMEKPDVKLKNTCNTIVTYVTESEYKLIRTAMTEAGYNTFNKFFQTIFPKKIAYLIELAQKYGRKFDSYKAVVFHTTKAQSKRLEAAKDYWNNTYKTDYSKSRFLILVANGIIKTAFDCSIVDDTSDTTITLNFTPSDLECFKKRYNKMPNSAILRSILDNTIR